MKIFHGDCSMALHLLLLAFMAAFIYGNEEGAALTEFRSELKDPLNVLQSWDPTLVNPCTWLHVICDKINHVVRIILGNMKLSGPLVPQIGMLKHLEYLELYRNNFTGKIPKELGNLKKLQSMDLFENTLTEEIPPSLGQLKSLRMLRLNNNKLKGQIPWELTTISSLKVLDLSNNDFCGVIPTLGSFSKFSERSFENNSRLKGPELIGSVLYDVDCNK